MNQLIWRGAFSLSPRTPGQWVLREKDGGRELWLGGMRGEIPAALLTPPGDAVRSGTACIDEAEVRWEPLAPRVGLVAAGTRVELHPAAAFAHEPLPGLYANLPLATLDARTRRFWRRIFLLVRVPGASALLRYIARRARARA